MRTVTFRLADLNRAIIPLGFVGENDHTQIIFDAKKIFDDYPNAIPALTVLPPKGASYPAVVIRDGDLVSWDVLDSDLIYPGNGELQLSFTQGEVKIRTYIARTKIDRSIVPTGEVPEPLKDFLEEASAAVSAIPQTIDDALAAAKASGEFDGKDGKDGTDGTDGYSPIATVTKSGDTATITITDKDGTTTATVSDGKDGKDGADGQPGVGVPTGGTQGQMLVKKSGTDYDTEWANQPSVPVQDVQVNGTSILSQGVANVPIATVNTVGVGRPGSTMYINENGTLGVNTANADRTKAGTTTSFFLPPARQHESAFYGLAKAAGADMASVSGATIGVYPEAQKRAICKMIGVPYPHGELIRDYTTTSDQTEVIINTDESNQSFELVKVKIIVVIPSTTTEAASNFFADVLTINELNGNDDTYKLPTLQSPTAGRTFFYEFETYGGYLTFSRAYYGSGFNTTINNFNTYVTDKSPKSITGFKFSQYSSSTSLVPSGTRIRIYGMRA